MNKLRGKGKHRCKEETAGTGCTGAPARIFLKRKYARTILSGKKEIRIFRMNCETKTNNKCSAHIKTSTPQIELEAHS
jgi:hypothetical protein